MPLSRMQVGKHYVREYMLSERGLNSSNNKLASSDPGLYLEWHGAPHLHAPLNSRSGGYLVLGKRVYSGTGSEEEGENESDDNFAIQLSRFAIPFGCGILTPGGCVHCDACLAGDYLVAYTLADDYETYIVKAESEAARVAVDGDVPECVMESLSSSEPVLAGGLVRF